jgi:hypothetical protein
MKTLALLVCVVAGAVLSQSQTIKPSPILTQYFPSGVFGPHSFNDRWYSSTLSALQEPSLFAVPNDKSLQVFRFLWLPSFHRPISVRLTINTDGTGATVTRSVDCHVGLLTKPASDTGKLILNATGVIDEVPVKEVLGQLQRLAFWSMPTEEEPAAPQYDSAGRQLLRIAEVDGARWILEGLRGGEYHVVDRWSPDDNSYSRLCKYLFRLGKVEATLY